MAEDAGPKRHESTDPMVGKVLDGRFSIIEVIGTGGMGRVYKAIQTPLDRIVALKVLNPMYGGGRDPNFQRRFFLEASLTAKLRHPNTITVIDYGRTEDGIFYIAMEYVEGQTLSQVLAAGGAMPWRRALQVTTQVCRSLREAHKLGIIHRDLKPANVMLLSAETDHDVVKVLDFGLVKSMEESAEPEITQAGMMLGSPLYMAPEQARHHTDARSDLYSLGVVLYQMLMGRPPFQAKESVDAIIKHMNQKPPTFAQLRPAHDIPPELEAVVMRCLEKDPAKRFQSMDELLEGLRNAARAAGASDVFNDPRTSSVNSSIRSAPRELPPPLPSEQSVEIAMDVEWYRNKVILGAAVAAVLVLGAGLGWLLTRPTGGDTLPIVASTTAPPRATSPGQAQVAANTPAPVPHPELQPEVQPRVEPAPVKFVVRTEPAGARVEVGDRVIGTTPVSFEQVRDQSGVAEAKLTLTLDGYQPSTITARGEGPEVAVKETLKRKQASTTRRPSNKKDDPYKDDPYQ